MKGTVHDMAATERGERDWLKNVCVIGLTHDVSLLEFSSLPTGAALLLSPSRNNAVGYLIELPKDQPIAGAIIT